MANTKSAKKALRQNKKRQLRNKQVKDNIKKLIKDSRKAIGVKSDKAKELVARTVKTVDKAVQKGILKKNTGNRKKSRLMKKFNTQFGIGTKNKE